MNDHSLTVLFKSYPMLMNRLLSDYVPPDCGIPLNRTQWRMLFILHNAGRANMSEMSRFMNIEKGSLTSVADSIIRNGLVRRIQDENDRRKIYLELTDRSDGVIRKGKQALNAHISGKLAMLPKRDVDALFQALRTIQTTAEKLQS